MKNSLCFCAILLMICGNLQAQSQVGSKGGEGQVRVINVDNLSYKKIDKKPVRILVGNVAFQKDSMIFKCDSAIQFIDDELIYAYKNVNFNQGDTLILTGDELIYDDKKEFAEIKGKTVVMTDSKMNLRTTALFYDMKNQIAYYLDSAYITDAENRLWSQKGYYYAKTKDMYFKKRVRLVNQDYDIKTDTLRYNVATENSYFRGPSHITTKDDDYIYCENGVFYSKGAEVRLGINSFLRSDGQFLYGDSLYYNSKTEMGYAFKRARLIDTLKNLDISGNYARFDRKDDAYMITDSLLMIQYEDEDTVYLTSDTLRIFYDSTKTNRIAIAHNNVRIYSSGYQAVCDSMVYHSSDSLIEYFGRPVFWMDSFQVSADFVRMLTGDDGIDKIYLTANSLLGQKHEYDMFDQIGGDSMTAFFRKGNMHHINVHSGARAIYYLLEEDSALIGANEVESQRAQIRFSKGNIQKLSFIEKSSSYVTPAESVLPLSLRLSGFVWRGVERPHSPDDLFRVLKPSLATELPPADGDINLELGEEEKSE